MLRVMLFDRQGNAIGELPEAEVFALKRTERVNGEHSLKITTTKVLQQGWRVLTCDERGKWREHVVYGTDAMHDSGDKPMGDYYCVWSLMPDLMGTRISAMPGTQTPVAAAVALAAALSGTDRWQVGTVTNTATGGASMYDTDGWTGLSTLLSVWGGEIDTTIEVGSTGVTARKVDLYAVQGEQEPKRRFDFGADLKSVRRRVADGPLYCRITPRGMGEEVGEGFGRKITIESVNDGKDWLENPAMVDLAKLPDGNGGWEYPTLEIDNPDCKTPADLLAWALTVLEQSTVPRVSYDIDVMQLAQEGVDMHGVSLGDAVHVVDRKFGEGVRISGRVLQTVTDMLDESDVQLTVGSISQDLASLITSMETRLGTVEGTVEAIAGTGGTDYYSNLIANLNAQINATGGYTYMTEGQGYRTYDTAVTDPLVGAEASKVVEVKGGTIRIANTKTAQGAWEWKTVFSSGLVASEVLSASNIITGALRVQDALGNAVFVADMDAGTVQMAGDAIRIGQRTLGDAVNVVYGTFFRDMHYDEARQYTVIDNYGGNTPQFVQTDDTVLKLKWLEDTNSWPSGSNWWFKLNGTIAAQNYGGRLQIPAGFRVQRNQLMILEIERYDESDQTKWRWLATGVEDAAQSTDLSDRARFARDTSEIEINGGKITFNAGTFVVNSDDFQVDEDGVITATAGTVGGMSLANDHIYNDAVDLYGQGLDFLYDDEVVGSIMPQYLEDAQHNLVGSIMMKVPYSFNLVSKLPGTSGNPTPVILYEKDTSDGNEAGSMRIKADVRFDGSATFEDGLTAGVGIPKVNGGGYFCALSFTNGLLTSIEYY